MRKLIRSYFKLNRFKLLSKFHAMVKFILTGLPRSVKSQEKTTFFQGQGKVGEFGIWLGKLFCKFAQKSGKIREI